MAERHDSTAEQGCFEAGREVGKWVGGGGSKRWQQSGGFPRCSSAGCRRSRLGAADRRVWELELELGLGLGWTRTGRADGGLEGLETAELPGDHHDKEMGGGPSMAR